MRTSPTRYRRAFTLVELLVVIAIIAVLISIMLPIASRALAEARLVNCKSNIRQLIIAHRMYGNDNKDLKPPLKARSIEPYASPNMKIAGEPVGHGILARGALKSIKMALCPASEMDEDNAMDIAAWNDPARSSSGSSYFYHWRGLSDPVSGITYRRAWAKQDRAMVMDIAMDPNAHFSNYIGAVARNIAHLRLMKTNVGYIDGSVTTFSTREVYVKVPGYETQVIAAFQVANKRY